VTVLLILTLTARTFYSKVTVECQYSCTQYYNSMEPDQLFSSISPALGPRPQFTYGPSWIWSPRRFLCSTTLFHNSPMLMTEIMGSSRLELAMTVQILRSTHVKDTANAGGKVRNTRLRSSCQKECYPITSLLWSSMAKSAFPSN
jgi:hypothetical protein